MIGGIEQKDAVHNVKVGMEQSFIITKSYFANMNLILKELMLDALNLGKIVYKDGLTGAIILGDKGQKSLLLYQNIILLQTLIYI